MKEEENTTLKDDLSNAKVELDSNKGQLLITKDTVQKLTQDKGNIYQGMDKHTYTYIKCLTVLQLFLWKRIFLCLLLK